MFKGYFHYKMITPQSVLPEAQVKNFFYFVEVIFRLQDIQVFLLFLAIPWWTKSVTSWWALVHKIGYIFEDIFWTNTH